MKQIPARRRPPSLSPRSQSNPLVIAGPCSAETEAQTVATARRLARDRRVRVFRAGIWKPRTRPDCFAGVGVAGLPWLQRVRRETGLPVAVEVARAQHVYEALKFGVDILWIGARTTTNPFSVQEVADALRGSEAPVWVKNPVNPDLSLWLGALERLTRAGVRRLGAIHRGFSTSEPGPYRNTPCWDLALSLRREAPEVPILCDPSHMGGRRELLAELASQALSLGFNGLMIEAHVRPADALSDADQQVSPSALSGILDTVWRPHRPRPADDPALALARLREEIDRLDGDLIRLLSRRNDVAARIGQFKKEHRLDALQDARWQQVLQDRLEQAARVGLDPQLVREIYLRIHDISLRVQAAVIRQ